MIPFVDLKSQFSQLEHNIREGINAVLEHGSFIMGPEVQELEKQLAQFTGVEHAVTCSSGTDALLMPLMAQGICPGDVVFTTPFTFIATAEVISLLGATPVFVDIDPRTFNIDPVQLEHAVTAVMKNDSTIYPLPESITSSSIPKAIIPVDLFGLPAEYDSIMPIADKEDLFVLEDAAQGFGGVYKGKRAGGLGHVGAVSFFPAKPLGCYGDGGALLTNDPTLAEQCISIRAHGKGAEKYDNIRIGLNARLDTLQAAILLPKLKVFHQELVARQRVADLYTDRLKHAASTITTPFVPEGLHSAWAQYSILCSDRDGLRSFLKQEGIPSMVYYPKPLHRQTAYQELGYSEGAFPVSERISETILSLPMHPYLLDDQVEKICAVVLSYEH